MNFGAPSWSLPAQYREHRSEGRDWPALLADNVPAAVNSLPANLMTVVYKIKLTQVISIALPDHTDNRICPPPNPPPSN